MLTTTVLLCAITVILAGRKWHVVRDRHRIFSAIGIALKNSKALRIGVLGGIVYLTVFLVFGGKGGRVHVLFGRLIWNAAPEEILMGLVITMLVSISMALFVCAVHSAGPARSGPKAGIGFAGTFLALLACFCP